MNVSLVHHEPKSRMAYPINEQTIHLRLQTNKDIVQNVRLLIGDPFSWILNAETLQREWEGSILNSLPVIKEYQTQFFDYWFIEVNTKTKRAKYAFLLNDVFLYTASGVFSIIEKPILTYDIFHYFSFPYILESDIYKAPNWVKDTVWYSIFPDRFHKFDQKNKDILKWESVKQYNNTMVFGGNVRGITRKLPYLEELGITGIYLTPLFLSPSTHKYDTVDYFEIDPIFGSKTDLKYFIDQAHNRKIRVIIDAVFNHVSFHHPFFQDVIKNGKQSAYVDFFLIKKFPVINYTLEDFQNPKTRQAVITNLHYETFAFSPKMPKLNVENPKVRKYLLEVASYWTNEFSIDGWRLDVSNEISHSFWREFRQVIKSINPEVYILGENWDRASKWVEGDQFDGVMNYSFMNAIWSYFGDIPSISPMNGREFRDYISTILFEYPKPVISNLYNLVDSHDTKRVMSLCNGNTNLLKLIYLFLFSLPGTPSIFYGGEIGLDGLGDPDNRKCMIWDQERQNNNLFEFIKSLTTIYHKEPSFRSSDFQWFFVNDKVLVYNKIDLVFILNKSNSNIEIDTTLIIGEYVDLFSNNSVYIDSFTTIDSLSFHVLKKM